MTKIMGKYNHTSNRLLERPKFNNRILEQEDIWPCIFREVGYFNMKPDWSNATISWQNVLATTRRSKKEFSRKLFDIASSGPAIHPPDNHLS